MIKLIKILPIILLLQTGIIFGSEKLMLNCGGTQILLNLQERKSYQIENDPLVIGSLEISDHMFLVGFPKSKSRYPVQIKIFRYTGTYEWEHGYGKFGILSPKNHYRSGECFVSEGKKKF